MEKEEKKTRKKKELAAPEKKETRGRKKKAPAKVNLNVRVRQTRKKLAPAAPEIAYEESEYDADEVVIEKQEEKPAAKRARIVHEREYRDKEIFVWLGVAVTMALLLFVWGVSLKNQFRLADAGERDADKEWQEMSADLAGKMEQMKADLEKVKAYNKQAAGGTASSTSAPDIAGASEEVVQELKDIIRSGSTTTPSSSVLLPEAEVSPTSSIEELKEILEKAQ